MTAKPSSLWCMHVSELAGRFALHGERDPRGSLRFPLQACNGKAILDDRELDVEVTDISLGGIGLMVRGPMEVGQRFLVEAAWIQRLPSGGFFEVRWTVPGTDEETCRIGAEVVFPDTHPESE